MNQDWNDCIDDNGATLGRCVYACNGNDSCEADCIDGFKNRQANCPCEVPIQRLYLYLMQVFRKIVSVAALVITTPVLKRQHLPDSGSPGVTTSTVPQTTTTPAVTTSTVPQTTTSSAVITSTAPQTTTSPVVNAVLVLSTYRSTNKPMIIDFDGKSKQGLL